MDKKDFKAAIFKIANEFYALDIMRVNNIKEYEVPNKIPNSKQFVKGVINLRGDVVPILDLREILGYEKAEDVSKSKIVIIENGDELLGLIIDEVLSISTIRVDQIEDMNKMSVDNFSDIIEGIAKLDDKLVAILSIDKILQK